MPISDGLWFLPSLREILSSAKAAIKTARCIKKILISSFSKAMKYFKGNRCIFALLSCAKSTVFCSRLSMIWRKQLEFRDDITFHAWHTFNSSAYGYIYFFNVLRISRVPENPACESLPASSGYGSISSYAYSAIHETIFQTRTFLGGIATLYLDTISAAFV